MKRERIPTKISKDSADAAKVVAEQIGELTRAKAAVSKTAVLGLATGHTPINVYRQLIGMHRQDGLDFPTWSLST